MNAIKVCAEHIGLASAAPAELAKWYEQVFGLRRVLLGANQPEPLEQVPSAKGPFFLAEPNTGFMIEIFFRGEFTGSDSVHFCFRVEDIEQAIALLPAGTEEVAARKSQQDGSQVYFFKDPAGHILQFIQR